jgi:hypothetical protein
MPNAAPVRCCWTLREAGTPATLSFSDSDAVIAIDTVDDHAGVGIWAREDLMRHRLLRLD